LSMDPLTLSLARLLRVFPPPASAPVELDLASMLHTVVGYFYFAAWIAVAGGIAYSAYLFATGQSERGRKALIGVVAGAFVVSFGYSIITSAVPQATVYNQPYAQDLELIGYAAAGIAVAAAAIYLAAGHMGKGMGYFLVAALLIFAVNFGPAFLSTSATAVNGSPVTVTVSANPAAGTVPLKAQISGQVYPGAAGLAVTVNEGNGNVVTVYTGSNGVFGPVNAEYDKNGTYTVTATVGVNGSVAAANTTVYAITLNNNCGGGLSGFFVCGIAHLINYLALEPVLQYLNPIFSAGFEYFVAAPTYGSMDTQYSFNVIGPEMQVLYLYTRSMALAFLGAFFALDVGWRVWETEGEGITDTVVELGKDVVVVAAVIFATPYLYNAFALLINQVAFNILGMAPTGVIITHSMGLIILGLVTGYFVPELAALGADLLFALILAFALAFIRFVVIGAAVGLAPILAVLWLFPPFRKVVTFFAEVVIGLIISGIFASAVLVLIAYVVAGDPSLTSIFVGIITPVITMILPEVLTFGVMGMIPGMGGLSSALQRARSSRRFNPTEGGTVIATGGGGGGSPPSTPPRPPPTSSAGEKGPYGRLRSRWMEKDVIVHPGGGRGGFKTTYESGGGVGIHSLFRKDFRTVHTKVSGPSAPPGQGPKGYHYAGTRQIGNKYYAEWVAPLTTKLGDTALGKYVVKIPKVGGWMNQHIPVPTSESWTAMKRIGGGIAGNVVGGVMRIIGVTPRKYSREVEKGGLIHPPPAPLGPRNPSRGGGQQEDQGGKGGQGGGDSQ